MYIRLFKSNTLYNYKINEHEEKNWLCQRPRSFNILIIFDQYLRFIDRKRVCYTVYTINNNNNNIYLESNMQ